MESSRHQSSSGRKRYSEGHEGQAEARASRTNALLKSNLLDNRNTFASEVHNWKTLKKSYDVQARGTVHAIREEFMKTNDMKVTTNHFKLALPTSLYVYGLQFKLDRGRRLMAGNIFLLGNKRRCCRR
jgi:hypothetical protein